MAEGEGLLGALRIEPAPEEYRAEGFDCGEEDLTDYICDGTSAGDESAGVSRSYLVLKEDELVGYFTVLADRIHLQTSERPAEFRKRYPNAPALKLGRMGVALEHRGQGVGPWILDNVVGLAGELSQKAGLRYITLDALQRPKLVQFYEDYGFLRNKSEGKREALWRKLSSWRDLPYISMRYDLKF